MMFNFQIKTRSMLLSALLIMGVACSKQTTSKITESPKNNEDSSPTNTTKKPEKKPNKKDVVPPMTKLEDGFFISSVTDQKFLLEKIDYEVHVLKIEKGKFKSSIVSNVDDKNNYKTPKILRDELDARLVINGGYFPQGKEPNIPDGLLILEGKKISEINPKLSGVLTIQENVFDIQETDKFKIENLTADASAIQGSPRLIERGGILGIQKPDLKSTKDKRTMRTAICLLKNKDVLFMITDPKKSGLYLYEMATIAKDQACDITLNLDGGPASSLSLKKYETLDPKISLDIPAQIGWIHPDLIVIE